VKKKHFIFIIQNNNNNKKKTHKNNKNKKIKVFFFKKNIVEITHLCIRHKVQTSMLEGSLNFARAFFNFQKAIKLEEIKERKN
jgi:hypothetical protein